MCSSCACVSFLTNSCQFLNHFVFELFLFPANQRDPSNFSVGSARLLFSPPLSPSFIAHFETGIFSLGIPVENIPISVISSLSQISLVFRFFFQLSKVELGTFSKQLYKDLKRLRENTTFQNSAWFTFTPWCSFVLMCVFELSIQVLVAC